ncbi:MAG: polyprenyl synthetase family protein [Candidatus Aminicenantes bacterium]|nr:polyprenyl synthetase family protein [Candidatus Aminicenantes bacterium]
MEFNISPHSDSSIEWWFVHGFCEGQNVTKRYFMTTLFRHKAVLDDARPKNAFSLLISTIDSQKKAQQTCSRIDQSLLDYVIGRKEIPAKQNIDQKIVDIFLEEIRKNGPPGNISLDETKVELKGFPFRVHWQDFSLLQKKKHIKLSFLEPGSKDECCFKLSPQNRPIAIKTSEDTKRLKRDIKYFSYPRQLLSGTVNGIPVAGEAWLDHQWGDNIWFLPNKPRSRMIGWDWFGINLEDGSNWIVTVLRDAKTRKPLVSHVTVQDKTGSIRSYKSVVLKRLRYWESPSTAICYPVEWYIGIPEAGAKLTFFPLSDNQEIPVFGFMRSVWEGAGHIFGKINGKNVKGYARGEFQGYGYIFDFKDYLKRAASKVDRHIKEFLPPKIDDAAMQKYVGPPTWHYKASVYTKMLSKPVWDLVSRGGKRWRPIFTLLLLDALGKSPAPYESLVSVLAELSHTGSLIIDDIEDSSLIRRGEECIHLRYGQDLAINASNTLYFLPTLILHKHPHLTDKQKLEIHELIMKHYIQAHFGQALDLYWSRNMNSIQLNKWLHDSASPQILQMYAFKTAAPVMVLAETAAIIAHVPMNVRKACIRFAQSLGVAFQIVDDIHNFKKSSKWKKDWGEDLKEGKLTYVIFRSLERLGKNEKNHLCQILSQPEKRKNPLLLQEGISLIKKSGALRSCHEEAKALIMPDWQKLSDMIPLSESKIFLHVLCSYLTDFKL